MTRERDILPIAGSWAGAQCGVLGLGASGIAATHLLWRENARVFLFEDRAARELTPTARELLDFASAQHPDTQARLGTSARLTLQDEASVAQLDALVVSPGVPGDHPVLRVADAAGVPVLSELELASRRLRGPLVVVTGTNGKSTTVSLIHHLLRTSGRRALLAGNIGTAVSDIVAEDRDSQPVVIEASSFQLERIHRFKPHVAVLLNIAPDHLDRYPDLEAYAQAKHQMLINMNEDDWFVFPRGDARAESWSAMRSSRPLRFTDAPLAAGEEGAELNDGWLIQRVDGEARRILAAEGYPLLGHHNRLNALAALAAVAPFDLPANRLAQGLQGFRGLPHRMEPAGTIGGVEFIDDSKATNVHAAAAALSGLSTAVVMLLGGRGKGEDYRALCQHLDRVLYVVCYGEEGDRIADALRSVANVERVSTMREAFDRAREVARAGDTVLLSPACASFDEFDSFAHRGDVFAGWVRDGAREEERS